MYQCTQYLFDYPKVLLAINWSGLTTTVSLLGKTGGGHLPRSATWQSDHSLL